MRDSGAPPHAILQLPHIQGYDVLEEIGRGSMGVVYRARQLAAGGRLVALKVMLGEAFARPEELRRFEREVEIAGELNHPNIARVYDSGLTHGLHYFAMEYIDGMPLDLYCSSRLLRLTDRLQIFSTVCEAVAFAHRRGIIHRDLKPSNILVDAEGNPHVLDFGLAKTKMEHEDAGDRSLLTMDGTLLGTLPYMAPEQAEGDTSSIDTRTDVYALGVILYEILTGAYPYEVTGQMADVLKRIAEAEPKRPSTVNRLIGDEVETIILRALHKAPDRRYPGAGDLARDVARFLAHEPIEAKRDSGWYVLRKTIRRYRLPLTFAALTMASLATTSIVALNLYCRAESRRREADDARLQERRQREIARASTQEVARRLARQHFNNGMRSWFDRDDATSAAAYFVEALKVSPEPFYAARMALRNATRECCHLRFSPWLEPAGRGMQPKRSVAVSPDGTRVVTTCSVTGAVHVRNLVTGEAPSAPLLSIVGVTNAAFSGDGTRLLTSAESARLWDAVTGHPLSPAIPGSAGVLSPDGKIIATASASPETRFGRLCNTAQLHDATTGRPIAAPLRHGQEIGEVVEPKGPHWSLGRDGLLVRELAFSPSGKHIFTRSGMHALLWDTDTGHRVSTLRIDTGNPIESLEFSRDATRVAVGFRSVGAHLWDLPAGREIQPPAASRRPSSVWRAVFSEDGKWLATAADDKTAMILDAATGHEISGPMEHSDGVRDVAFSPTGSYIVTAAGAIARVWHAKAGRPVSAPLHHSDRLRRAVFTPDGRSVLTASTDGTLRVWEWSGDRQPPGPMRLPGRMCDISPDSTRIATAVYETSGVHDGNVDRENTVCVWDLRTGAPSAEPMRHPKRVFGVKFSPDARRIVTSCSDHTVRIWDIATMKPLSEPIVHRGYVHEMIFSPDGRWIVTVCTEGTASLLDAMGGKVISAPLDCRGPVYSVSFSPDSKRLMTASADKDRPSKRRGNSNEERDFLNQTSGSVRFWDPATGVQRPEVIAEPAVIVRAAFSPDGGRVLTESARAARIWDSQTGQQTSASMIGIRRAMFGPDGKRIIAVCEDGKARMWDGFSGQVLPLAFEDDRAIGETAFSDDGRFVFTSSSGLRVRTWDAATGQALSACMERVHLGRRCSISADGRWVITSTESEHSSRVCDASTGHAITREMCDRGGLGTARFTPDGRFVITHSFGPFPDGVLIHVFDDVDWREPIELVEARVRARLGVDVDATGEPRVLAAEQVVAAWDSYRRLLAEYERTCQNP